MLSVCNFLLVIPVGVAVAHLRSDDDVMEHMLVVGEHKAVFDGNTIEMVVAALERVGRATVSGFLATG